MQPFQCFSAAAAPLRLLQLIAVFAMQPIQCVSAAAASTADSTQQNGTVSIEKRVRSEGINVTCTGYVGVVAMDTV